MELRTSMPDLDRCGVLDPAVIIRLLRTVTRINPALHWHPVKLTRSRLYKRPATQPCAAAKCGAAACHLGFIPQSMTGDY
ncbi:hypothetical protein [Paraburkholderia fungorum]|uniref:hypothetical protein n=1 Tax=Paraburkholderia fungorum TaxID=134537 RepID=UPI00115FF4B1|nr:hypothetical protein [Paraburkholderia fungorum]